MNEKDLMEMIRNSAEEVEIPDSLQPEQIQKKLEQIHTEKTKPKKKVIPFRKYASIAAALLLVAAAVPLVPLVTKNYDTKPELVQTEVP